MKSSRRCRAFSMWEMLYALILITFALLMSAKLFTPLMRVISGAPAAQEKLIRSESMLVRMREDVWQASELSSNDAQTLQCTTSDGHTITWRIDHDDVTRSAPVGVAERWIGVGKGVSIAVDNAHVTLRSERESGEVLEPVVMTCESKLIDGMTK